MNERLFVQQEPNTGVPLTVDGVPLLTLKVSYQCNWDTAKRFLAVDRSHVKVYAGHLRVVSPCFASTTCA